MNVSKKFDSKKFWKYYLSIDVDVQCITGLHIEAK